MDYYERFRDYEKEELFKIVLSPDDYQHEGVIAAKQVITEKGWTRDLEVKQEKHKAIKEQEQKQYEQEIIEKAEYYRNALEFKSQGNTFQIRLADIPKFEGALAANNIDYFREDKNIGAQLDKYPTQSYYFKNEDIEIVDKIARELSLTTAPYTDYKPFFKFEIKVLLIAVVVVLILVLFFVR
jgi:hypothetical protein